MKLWLPFLIVFLFFAPYTTQGLAQQLGDDKPSSPTGVLGGTENQEGKFKYEEYMAVSPYGEMPVRKTPDLSEDVDTDIHAKMLKAKSNENFTCEEPVIKEKVPLGTIRFNDYRGHIYISSGGSTACFMPASISTLKAWGFQQGTIALFDKRVEVSVLKEPGKTWASGVEIRTPSNEVYMTKETMFDLYRAIKKTNDKDTLGILTDSLYAVGAQWDFCKYDYGKKYVGFTFLKEMPSGNPVVVNNLSFPATFYPIAQQKLNRALVATLWLDIAKSAKEKDAKTLRKEAIQLLEPTP